MESLAPLLQVISTGSDVGIVVLAYVLLRLERRIMRIEIHAGIE